MKRRPATPPTMHFGAPEPAARASVLFAAAFLALGPAHAARQDDGAAESPATLDAFARAVTYDLGQQIALLRGPFEEIIAAIDGLDGLPGRTTMEARRRSLLELGPAAVPLMAPYVDPAHPRDSEAGTLPGRLGRAEIIRDALAAAASIAATDPLLAIANSGSRVGRVLALQALRSTPDAERVLGPLIELIRSDVVFKQEKQPALPPMGLGGETVQEQSDSGEGGDAEDLADGIARRIAERRRAQDGGGSATGRTPSAEGAAAEIKAEALRTIASLRTPEADAFVVQQLTGEDTYLRAAAVEALVDADPSRSAPMLLELVSSDGGWASVNEIIGYYDAHDRLLQEIPHAEAFVRLSLDERLNDVQRARLFDLMRETDTRMGQTDKRKIEQRFTGGSVSATLLTSAQKLLARTGSRTAKRDLLAPFDDRIRRGRNLGAVMAERAALLHEIGDYSAAVRDWRDVIDRAGGNVSSDIAVGLARSLARAKKFRDAQETLQRSSLSLQQLRGLAGERDFREMAESRYADAFHLED